MSHAVVVVDVQNDYFPSGSWPLVGIDAAAANVARVIAQARSRQWPVVHIRHLAPSGAPFFVEGTPGSEIHASVTPLATETVVIKHYPNSFRETSLQEHLQSLGVTSLVVVGAMSHMCIDATTRAAADLGYTVTVLEDACATRDLTFGEQTVPAAQVHAAFMSALAFAYASVGSTEAWLAS